jgi:hypothetical protein
MVIYWQGDVNETVCDPKGMMFVPARLPPPLAIALGAYDPPSAVYESPGTRFTARAFSPGTHPATRQYLSSVSSPWTPRS